MPQQSTIQNQGHYQKFRQLQGIPRDSWQHWNRNILQWATAYYGEGARATGRAINGRRVISHGYRPLRGRICPRLYSAARRVPHSPLNRLPDPTVDGNSAPSSSFGLDGDSFYPIVEAGWLGNFEHCLIHISLEVRIPCDVARVVKPNSSFCQNLVE